MNFRITPSSILDAYRLPEEAKLEFLGPYERAREYRAFGPVPPSGGATDGCGFGPRKHSRRALAPKTRSAWRRLAGAGCDLA